MGVKRALTVGINYPGSNFQLRGCVEDSHTIVKMLRERYGFEDITQLLDGEATTRRIKEELVKLINGSKPGDVLFFHFSGHGTQIIDDADPDHEPDGLDEIICPVDFNWRDKVIKDDDFKAMFDAIPSGVNLTVFLDCCNSGSGIDAEHEYQADPDATREGIGGSGRYLPPPAEVQAKINESKLHPKPRLLSRQVNNSCMLISGARSYQTAADAKINGVFQGATTYFMQRALDELGAGATHYQLVHALNRFMVQYNFSQRPQLDGATSLHHKTFLAPYTFGNKDAVTEYVLPPEEEDTFMGNDDNVNLNDKPVVNIEVDNSVTVNTNKPEKKEKKDKDDKKDNKKLFMIGGAVLAVAAVIAIIANL